jgi:hypothetical protein
MNTLSLSKFLLTLAVVGVCCGCDRNPRATSPSVLAAGTLVSDPVAAVKSVLPKGWTVLEVKEHTSPLYAPEGDGTLIVAGDAEQQMPGAKPRAQFSIWIMPPSYEDRGEDPKKEIRQTVPPQLLATGKNAKVYAWGLPSELHDTLTKALFR